jgi:inhibitor of KinA sporulation pathway (predicted exonuclease)
MMDLRRRLLIIDLEATCWEAGRHRPDLMETIEIGAVLVDPDSARTEREFQTFVHPVRTHPLSPFCRSLTSIRQEDVDSAPGFPEALAQLCAWLGDSRAARFGSWGDYDRKQVVKDCNLHGVAYPFAPDHINLKKLVARLRGTKRMGMGQALASLGLELDGTHHRALDDARNIWRVVAHVTGGDLTELV